MNPNPLIEAMVRALKGQAFHAMNYGCDTFSPPMRGWVRHRFGDEAIREVGTIFLCAIANSDRSAVPMLRDAIRAADHIFKRTTEPLLLAQALDCMWEMPCDSDGRIIGGVEAIKKRIEKRFNHGKTLSQHKWSRVRRILGWPALTPGAKPGKPRRRNYRHETGRKLF
jgi:hypothetical protein